MAFPSWMYGPNGASAVFKSAEEVPAGWADHPSKVVAELPAPPADPVELPAAPDDAKPGLSRKQITDALAERKIPFSKNTPTKALYDKLLEVVEASEA